MGKKTKKRSKTVTVPKQKATWMSMPSAEHIKSYDKNRQLHLTSQIRDLVHKKEIIANYLEGCEQGIYDRETDIIQDTQVLGNIFTGLNCNLFLEQRNFWKQYFQISDPFKNQRDQHEVYNWERFASNSSVTSSSSSSSGSTGTGSTSSAAATSSSASWTHAVQFQMGTGNAEMKTKTKIKAAVYRTSSSSEAVAGGNSAIGGSNRTIKFGKKSETNNNNNCRQIKPMNNEQKVPEPNHSNSKKRKFLSIAETNSVEIGTRDFGLVPIGQPRFHKRAPRSGTWYTLQQRESFAVHKVSKEAYHHLASPPGPDTED